jgi:hypothetical protein
LILFWGRIIWDTKLGLCISKTRAAESLEMHASGAWHFRIPARLPVYTPSPHSPGSPVANPRLNAAVRWAAEPWVKASGFT